MAVLDIDLSLPHVARGKVREIYEADGGLLLIATDRVSAFDVILNQGVYDNVVEVAPYFQERLQGFADHPHIGEARGVGLMGALELVADKESKAPFPPEQPVSEQIANVALENGLICRPIGQAIVLAPPFIITKDQIDELFDKLQKTLDQVLGAVEDA